MITVSETITSDLSPGPAFDYLSAFEHTMQWDPGTPLVTKHSPGEVAVGHKYHAEAEFKGTRQAIDYEVTELQPGRIRLRGENKTVISVDTISVAPSGAGSTVTYTAEFTLKGLRKLATPFVAPAFHALAAPAVQGLKKKLDELAAGRLTG